MQRSGVRRAKTGATDTARFQGEAVAAVTGRAFFGMLAVFAQFETDVRRDRRAEGIATAKKAGVYTGGKPRIDRRAVLDLLEAGDGPTAAARALGVSRMSIYRIIEEDRGVKGAHDRNRFKGSETDGPTRTATSM